MDEFKEIDDDEVDNLVADDHTEVFNKLLDQNRELTDQLFDKANTPDEVRQQARTFALQKFQVALETIAELMVAAEKDATRLSAARTIVNIGMATTTKDGDDPISDLFDKIAKDGSKKSSD